MLSIEEEIARSYELDFLQPWGVPFGTFLLEQFEPRCFEPQATILISRCRTGFLPISLLSKISESGRIIAVDASGEMLTVARQKLVSGSHKNSDRVFFSTQPLPKLKYAENVFDLTISDSGVFTRSDLKIGLSELYRVTKSMGKIGLVVPVIGTFSEFYDMFREALVMTGLTDLFRVLECHLELMLTKDRMEEEARALAIDPIVISEGSFEITFQNGEDFLLSKIVEQSYLPLWLSICPDDSVREVVFYKILKLLNTYFRGVTITSTVRMCVLIGTKTR